MENERWTRSDYDKGLCTLDQIGKGFFEMEEIGGNSTPKQESCSEQSEQSGQSESPGSFVALTKPERKRLTQELSDKLLIMAHENPGAFMDNAGPQINKFLDAASRLEGDEENGLPYTSAQIAKMTHADLKTAIIRSLSDTPLEQRIQAIHAGQVIEALLPFVPVELRADAMTAVRGLTSP